jgi:hypothetical protein
VATLMHTKDFEAASKSAVDWFKERLVTPVPELKAARKVGPFEMNCTTTGDANAHDRCGIS